LQGTISNTQFKQTSQIFALKKSNFTETTICEILNPLENSVDPLSKIEK